MFKHRDIPIEINSNGYFKATLGDVDISQLSLQQAKDAIDAVLNAKPKRAMALKVVGIQVTSGSGRKESRKIVHVTVVGINRTTRDLQYADLPKGAQIERPLPDTPANAALAERLLKAEAEIDEVHSLVSERLLYTGGYGRIDIQEYEELAKALEQHYQEVSKLK